MSMKRTPVTYGTKDELNYLRELLRRRKFQVLRAEYAALRSRRWDGEGMAVDVERVEQWLSRTISTLPPAEGVKHG
jgi:predicted aminopeptidase